MVIGSRIKKLREAKGLSQQIVADQLGMTQANYHKLESDKIKLKIETLERLAEFYDVSILDLLESDRNVFNIKNKRP
jgi:transcriptional regulator with XRE-family HTH domain